MHTAPRSQLSRGRWTVPSPQNPADDELDEDVTAGEDVVEDCEEVEDVVETLEREEEMLDVLDEEGGDGAGAGAGAAGAGAGPVGAEEFPIQRQTFGSAPQP